MRQRDFYKELRRIERFFDHNALTVRQAAILRNKIAPLLLRAAWQANGKPHAKIISAYRAPFLSFVGDSLLRTKSMANP